MLVQSNFRLIESCIPSEVDLVPEHSQNLPSPFQQRQQRSKTKGEIRYLSLKKLMYRDIPSKELHMDIYHRKFTRYIFLTLCCRPYALRLLPSICTLLPLLPPCSRATLPKGQICDNPTRDNFVLSPKPLRLVIKR
jgi:hypothetical protein